MRRLILSTYIAMLCQTTFASTGEGMIKALANCDPAYFNELMKHHKSLEIHGIPFEVNGKFVRIIAPNTEESPVLAAKTATPLSIGGFTVLGFINGVDFDEFSGSTQYTWGLWVAPSVDEAAKAINIHLAPERQVQKLHGRMYVRSEMSEQERDLTKWRLAQPLRFGTPPQGKVEKGLIIEDVPSLDAEWMTWVTCNLHGSAIQYNVLKQERPDLINKHGTQ